MIKKLLFFGLLSCFELDLYGVVSVGDTPGGPATFQFSVGSAMYDPIHAQIWTVSGQAIPALTYSSTVQSYGIAYTPFIPIDGSLNIPLVSYPYLPSTALVTTIDIAGNVTIPDVFVTNPLLEQALSSVTFVTDFITVVTAATPQYVYLIQYVNFLDNAYGKESPVGLSIMNQLDLGDGMVAQAIGTSQTSALFIAQSQGIFGTDSSSLLFALPKADSFAFVNDQSTTFTVLASQASLPIATTTPVLTASGTDVASIGSSVILYPSSINFSQMYVGLDVTANTQADSVAVAAFVATANVATESTLATMTFSPLLYDSVVPKTFQTPISTTAGNEVMVANMTTQLTSTGLSYIIASRYDGVDQQSVYAMPMVTMGTDTTQNGMIADFSLIAQTFVMIGSEYRVQGFSQALIDATEINIAGSADVVARLQVGNGPVPLVAGQLIEQVVAQGDAVYITIQQAFATGNSPGMFKSQALFDAQGRIMTWSPWQRVAGTDDQMLFAIKDRITDATMYVGGATSNSIQQTVWSNSADLQAFISKINGFLPSSIGGVQGIFPYSSSTQGFTALPDSQVSMLIATGNNNVVVAQTGQLVDDTFQILTQTNDTSILLSADTGLTIGSVVTTAFGTDSTAENNWLFMAGDGGLAVLSQADGSGFDTLPNDGAASFLIADGQTCKTIGNFSFVKKIVFNGSYLYVMTQNAVYQFSPLASQFTATSPADLQAVQVILATQLAPNAYCTDMLVDNELILLGTTAGLYSINTQSGIPGTITPITIPGGLSTVSRLQTISNSMNVNELFYTASNLYVLSIDFSVQQARLNRFTITDGQVTPIQDQLVQGVNGPLLLFDYMNNNIFIDGSLGFTTSYRIGSLPPAALYMEYSLQAGRSSSQTLLRSNCANLSIAAIVKSLGLSAIAREYASGCLMLAADFGLLADS